MSSEFWDKHAHKYDAEIQKRDDIYLKSLARTRDFINSGDNILDYGCGSGQIAIDLAPSVGYVHGIDYSAKMIELAKTKGASIKNVQFSNIDIFHEALMPGSFNAILAFDIIHLVEDPLKILLRVSDLLTKEGLLISMTPCFGDRNLVIRILISLARAFQLIPSIYYYKVNELQALVEEAGLLQLNSNIINKKLTTLWLVAQKPAA